LAQRYFNKGHTKGVVELLRVAVDDATLRVYIRAMQAWLAWMDSTDEVTLDWSDVVVVDYCLALYFSAVCFDLELLPHVAGSTLAAVLHFQPRFHSQLPRAARAARAFRALVRTEARLPFSRGSVGAIIAALLLCGHGEAAMLVAYLLDIVGRGQQDWEQVCVEDVHLPGASDAPIGITLGRSCRKEKVKTGFDQGVLVRCAVVRGWLRARVQRLRQWSAKGARAKVFSLSPQEFRRVFAGACAELGLPAETPHVLRHTAATELWASGRVTLAELMLRGRWQSESSVKRYTKPHLLAAHESKVPPAVLELGKAFWTDPASFVARGRRVVARQ